MAAGPAEARPKPAPEIRALWVDAFHPGIRSPEEIAQLVADARRLNVNTLIVQVRRRGDALYRSKLEPPLDDPAYDPRFDALAETVRRAHAAGLKVHAWINAMPVWRDEAPPTSPLHVFNRHGVSATGDENWLTRSKDGNARFPVGYFLDPGHPAAREHLVSVYLDIVRRYRVDGIHFDYIRYPETEGRLPKGADVGYNPVSLARFSRATGSTEVPAPDDPAWIEWRRRQVTELVRRISIEAHAMDRRLRVSVAAIAWGAPPQGEAGFQDASPMQRVFQDWQAWLAEGLIDFVAPMNYAREHDATVRAWFDGWIAWEKAHTHGRQLVIGIGGYLSGPAGVLAQIARARERGAHAAADGVSIFSYFSPSLAPPGSTPAAATPGQPPPPPRPGRLDFLVRGADSTPGAFIRRVPVPPMPWLDHPDRGSLAGTFLDRSGAGIDGVRVTLARRDAPSRQPRELTTDANGWFGAAGLEPGRYRVTVDGARGPAADVKVRAGRMSDVRVTSR